jgi:hypothetical protein
MKARTKTLYHPLFRQLNILPFHSEYTFSLSMFVVKNLDIYKFNTAIHSTSTRQGTQLHFPTNKLAKV